MRNDRYKILAKYNFQVPRYTSFPPATQFREVESSERYAKWLSHAGKNISLYVHIPFCARLCYYCGCHMRVVNNYQPVLDYIDVLKTEISLLKNHLPDNTEISHIHFGGGSPTILRPRDFTHLVKAIEKAIPFAPNIEFGIEADPRNLSEAKIAAYAKCGVNRISLGVQDFDDTVLGLINRPQPFHSTYNSVESCRTYGIDDINFDLMYGLPGQSRDSILKTLDLAVSLKPSRIAYFGYAHVPWMKRHMNLMPQDRIPAAKDRYELQEAGAEYLESAGYTPIGIDHFCLPNDSMRIAHDTKKLYRNFQGYTTDGASYLIGIGASSISSFPEGYAQNRVDTKSYMDEVRLNSLPIKKMLLLKKEDYPIKKIIEELMCYMQVDLNAIKREFSLPANIFQQEENQLKVLEEDGIVGFRNGILTIKPEYRVLARVVCEVFDPYTGKEASLQKHAQAV